MRIFNSIGMKLIARSWFCILPVVLLFPLCGFSAADEKSPAPGLPGLDTVITTFILGLLAGAKPEEAADWGSDGLEEWGKEGAAA